MSCTLWKLDLMMYGRIPKIVEVLYMHEIQVQLISVVYAVR